MLQGAGYSYYLANITSGGGTSPEGDLIFGAMFASPGDTIFASGVYTTILGSAPYRQMCWALPIQGYYPLIVFYGRADSSSFAPYAQTSGYATFQIGTEILHYIVLNDSASMAIDTLTLRLPNGEVHRLANTYDWAPEVMLQNGGSHGYFNEGDSLWVAGNPTNCGQLLAVPQVKPGEVVSAIPMDADMATVYPNPARRDQLVRIKTDWDDVRWRIVGLNGSIISKGVGTEIDISQLTPGVYMVWMVRGDGLAVAKKLLVQ